MSGVECSAAEQCVQGRRGRIVLLRPVSIRLASNEPNREVHREANLLLTSQPALRKRSLQLLLSVSKLAK